MKAKALHSIALAALLGFSSVASAAVYNWEVNPTHTSPNGLSGSFDFNSTTSIFDNVALTWLDTQGSGSTATFNSLAIVGSVAQATSGTYTLSFDPASNITSNTSPSTPTALIWNLSGGMNIPSGNQTTSFNVAAAPVPEPQTYAMFLAGLGLLGFARRAKKA